MHFIKSVSLKISHRRLIGSVVIIKYVISLLYNEIESYKMETVLYHEIQINKKEIIKLIFILFNRSSLKLSTNN